MGKRERMHNQNEVSWGEHNEINLEQETCVNDRNNTNRKTRENTAGNHTSAKVCIPTASSPKPLPVVATQLGSL